MSKVIDEIKINRKNDKAYTILILDSIPKKKYNKFLIKGEKYTPLEIYDAKNCIGIISNENFIGETVEFI